MIEYAILGAEMALGTVGAFTSSAEMWLRSLNWQMIGYAALGLVGLRIAAWALRRR
jgi:hypothetical protein